MLGEEPERGRRDGGNRTAQRSARLLQEASREKQQILRPLAQRRDGDGGRAQPEEQILPEAAGLDLALQRPVGRGDEPHVDLPLFGGAEP